MNSRPTREEILAKYRNQINADDFEILSTQELPPPSQLQREGAWLEYLGPLQETFLYLKRKLYGPVVVISAFGGFMQGLEYLDKYTRIGFATIEQVVQLANEHCEAPATHYVIALRDPEALPNHSPVQLPSDDRYPFKSMTTTTSSTTTTTTTTTSTTTTTPSPQQLGITLPIGSGIIPYSREWPQSS